MFRNMGMNFGQTVIFLSEGNSLKELKLHFVGDINVPKFTCQLGVFSFRAFLNIGMLLTESEKAKQLRTRILDIVIATINGRSGGGTKYINWRDRNYLPTAIKSENYLHAETPDEFFIEQHKDGASKAE